MALKLYDDTNVQAIANAIRSKNFQSTTYKISEMASAINALQTGLELLPQDTVSGAIVNFPDGSNGYPVVSLESTIEVAKIGTGTPSPDNTIYLYGFNNAMVSRSKKNLCGGDFLKEQMSNAWSSGLTFTDRHATFSANSVNASGIDGYFAKFNYKQDTRYTFIFTFKKSSGTSANLRIYYTNGDYINVQIPNLVVGEKGTFIYTTPSDKKVRGIKKYNSGGTTTLYLDESGIFEGNITTEQYEQYNGSYKEISFGAAGRVFGGTLNVTTGVLTVTKQMVDMGDLTYTYDSQYTRMTAELSDAKEYELRRFPFICEKFQTIDDGRGISSVPDNSVYGAVVNDTVNVYFKTSTYTDPATFKSDFTGTKLVYDLAEPLVFQLTPEQLLTAYGENNIVADVNGDLDVTYRADVELYIQKKLAESANS